MRVLIVEDNELVADAVASSLSTAGFTIDRVPTAEQARAAFLTAVFDAAIIDLGLPGEDGFSLVRHLRSRGIAIPFLILTARQAIDDKVMALELGADDFLAKPFAQAELIARCRALLRRAHLEKQGSIVLGRMHVDLNGRCLQIDGNNVVLTAREWTVLDYLIRHSGKIVAKERLLQAIASWEKDVTTNAIEVYVSRLRVKLGDAAVIRSVRGLGYRLEEKQ